MFIIVLTIVSPQEAEATGPMLAFFREAGYRVLGMEGDNFEALDIGSCGQSLHSDQVELLSVHSCSCSVSASQHLQSCTCLKRTQASPLSCRLCCCSSAVSFVKLAACEADILCFQLMQRPFFGPIFWVVLEEVFAVLPNIGLYMLVSDIVPACARRVFWWICVQFTECVVWPVCMCDRQRCSLDSSSSSEALCVGVNVSVRCCRTVRMHDPVCVLMCSVCCAEQYGHWYELERLHRLQEAHS